MNREEIRKLIGGYATGSLTPKEQKLLFEAALDDQALFDELLAEQDLKDLIEEPGARDRLLEALETEPVAASRTYAPHPVPMVMRADSAREAPSPRWYRRPATWAAAGALAAALALIAILPRAFQSDAPPPVELARNREADAPKIAESLSAPPPAAPIQPPASRPLPRVKPPVVLPAETSAPSPASAELRKAAEPFRAGEKAADAAPGVAATAAAEVARVDREEKKESLDRVGALGGRVSSMRAQAPASAPAPQAAAAVLSQAPAAALSYEVNPKEGFTPGQTVRITARAAGGGSIYLFRRSAPDQWTPAGEGQAPITFQIPTAEADRQLEFRLVYSPAPVANAAGFLVEDARKANELRDRGGPGSAVVLPIVIRARP